MDQLYSHSGGRPAAAPQPERLESPENPENRTRAFRLYEEGRRYNSSLQPSYYTLVDRNTEFFTGNQWPEDASAGGTGTGTGNSPLPKPVFNIIKRITGVLVSQITSGGLSVNLEPLSFYKSQSGAVPDDADASASAFSSLRTGRGTGRSATFYQSQSGAVPDDADASASAFSSLRTGRGTGRSAIFYKSQSGDVPDNASASADAFAFLRSMRAGSSDNSFNTTEFAQAEINNLIEKLKLEYRIRDALFDGARTGDYCAHFYWDPAARPYGGTLGSSRGEIRMELVDGVNVMFGNPNTPEVEDQPYILLIGRDTVQNLRAEYLRYHPGDEAGAMTIRADADWNEQAASGGKLELTGDENAKCLYLYLYSRTQGDDPTVLVSKYTRSTAIFGETDTGLRHYPVAWGNWERQKNCYHGRALVTGILPNQIFINAMYAMVMRHLYLVSFPKIVYNADLVPRWTNEVGASIAVHGLQPGQSIDQVATVVRPADMSGQILGTISNVEALTRECLGVTDVQMGTEHADNTSAIMVLQQNAEVPLENIRSGLYEWMEHIVEILLDMMGTYYGIRPIVRTRRMDAVSMDPATGLPLLDPATGMMKTSQVERRVLEPFDFSVLREVWLNIRVDVGSSTAYSEVAMTQTLDNLREAGLLSAEDYLERIPDKLVPMKQDLIDQLRQQQVQQDGVAAGRAIPDARSAGTAAAAGAAGAVRTAGKTGSSVPDAAAIGTAGAAGA